MDERVQIAVGHWAARFIANGVNYSDFVEVTSGLESWDQWCEAWCARAAFHEGLGEEAVVQGFAQTAGEHLTRAGVYYHYGKFLFVHDITQMRAAHERAVACRNKALDLIAPRGMRVEIPFEDTHLAGNFRLPGGVKNPPLVIIVMGLDSTKEEVDDYENRFLARGLATLSVDGPGQGEAEYELAIRPDFDVPFAAVFDWVEANRKNDVDINRIGLMGISFGGYHAPRIAAFEPRVKACIALSGPFDFGAMWDKFPDLSKLAFQVRSKKANLDEARDYAREFTLEAVASNISCPLYIVTGALDRVIPADSTEKLATAVSGPVICDIIEGATHVANNRDYVYRPKTADWMAKQLNG